MLFGGVTFILPVNLALNLSLEMSGVATANQSHFNVLVRVRLQLTGHGLQFDVISASYKKL